MSPMLSGRFWALLGPAQQNGFCLNTFPQGFYGFALHKWECECVLPGNLKQKGGAMSKLCIYAYAPIHHVSRTKKKIRPQAQGNADIMAALLSVVVQQCKEQNWEGETKLSTLWKRNAIMTWRHHGTKGKTGNTALKSECGINLIKPLPTQQHLFFPPWKRDAEKHPSPV